jgi:GDP-L-fucose synthase
MASTPFELKGKTVFVAGHRGIIGSALVRRLGQEDVQLIIAGRHELDQPGLIGGVDPCHRVLAPVI